MSYEEDHAEDVASDFRDALSELTMNSRVEITTLTVIARENTEYAHGISEVLQEHIKKVRPHPAAPPGSPDRTLTRPRHRLPPNENCPPSTSSTPS